ncbi:hypothetical protein N9026_00140 [bacterium]|nr:hypothetical protein [bacterium]
MYKHIAGPHLGGLFVDYEQNPKLQQPKTKKSNVIASDSFRQLVRNKDGSISSELASPYGYLMKGKNRYRDAEIGR